MPKYTDTIFVFGSNLAGRHGKGAAYFAKKYHGAVDGQGVGLQGQSYAIPTKDKYLRPMTWGQIEPYWQEFLLEAINNPKQVYELTPIGCGLAGNNIRWLLKELQWYDLPDNIVLSRSWLDHFKEIH